MTHLTKKIILDAIKYSASLDNSFISGWWICNDDNTVFLPLLQVARRVYNDEFDYAYELDYAETFKKLGINVRLKKDSTYLLEHKWLDMSFRTNW